MDAILRLLQIRSHRTVVVATLALTALCVSAPVASLAVLLGNIPMMPPALYWGILAVCAAIPLLIAPPIAFLGLHILRILTLTIDKVDEYVRLDTLTGVLTRAYLLGKTRDILPNGGAFLMCDADHFKAINDTYGHDVGDLALKRLADVLRKALPSNALIGRLGGEEFGVFLPGANDQQAAEHAHRLCATMREEGRIIGDYELKLTISIGGAVHVLSDSLEKTMKLADAALYQAKRSGRDQYFIVQATDTMPALILKSAGMQAC